MKKQGCLRCKSGPVLSKKLPVNFSKAYLLHINVNILYRRCLFSASAFSISAENPDIFVMTHCRMKAAGSLHAVRSRCRLSAVPFRHFMCPCRMGVIYKKHGFGFILPLFMSIELWAEAFGCGRFIKHICVHADKKEKCQAVYYQPLGIFSCFVILKEFYFNSRQNKVKIMCRAQAKFCVS